MRADKKKSAGTNEKKNAQMSRILLNSTEIFGIYTSDYKIKFHGRGISKLLNENQRTISNKLSYLEKLNLLKSDAKGTIKEYYINFENPIVYDLLIIAEENKSMQFLMSDFRYLDLFGKIRRITDSSIIVFGSYARKDYSKESDLDILLLGRYDKEKVEETLKLYPVKIHLMNMSSKEFERGLLKKENFMLEILKNHIIIKGTADLADIFWRYYNG